MMAAWRTANCLFCDRELPTNADPTIPVVCWSCYLAIPEALRRIIDTDRAKENAIRIITS